MSKRRIKNGINKLTEEVLDDLSPDTRVQLLLEAYGTGKREWSRSLAETCPRHRYIQPDQRVVRRMKMLYLFAAQAVYELHTTYLEYQLYWQKQCASWLMEDLSEDELEAAQVRSKTVQRLAASLYVLYHSYRRFATETLGVEVDRWLQLHPNGPAVFAAVGDLLDDRRQSRFVEVYVTELREETGRTGEVGDGDRDEALDWLVDQWYTGLVESWERTIAQAP